MSALHQLLDAAAQRRPDHVAVEDPDGGTITYRGLSNLSDRVRDRLRRGGIRPGDRVGVFMTKSIDAVASIFGILKTGAAYVPVDPTAPVPRNAYIFNDCAVKAAIVEHRFVEPLRAEMEKLGSVPSLLPTEGTGGGRALDAALAREAARDPAPTGASATPAPEDLAYILYTSGSTGRPKGVILNQESAIAFIDWCSETFRPAATDRFSSHAPFHFDLSILDIYVPLKHGATLVLVGHEAGKDPRRLAPYIAERRLTVWYSAPSILGLLAQHGELERHDFSALRLVLFAGEVFPVKHLRRLKQLIPHPRYFNLYGPTETNVCTFLEIPPTIPDERTEPYPIGETCAHYQARVIDEHGRDVARGDEGELCIAGPGVMQGYWNLPENTARGFIADPAGRRWYRTGDLVVEEASGGFIFHGRRDRMVKRRGYRVELGEIEACLYRHPSIRQAAVIGVPQEDGVRVKAFVSTRDGQRLSLIALKTFCSEQLPVYMVPDEFAFQPSLPMTSTDKIDYQRLKELA